MRKLGLALCLVLLGLVPAQPQPVTSPVNADAGAYNSSPPTCIAGQFCWLQVDSQGRLIITTGSGSIVIQGNVSNASSGVATTSTNVPTVSYNYGFNGTTWDQLQVDANKSLKIVTWDAAGNARGANVNASNQLSVSLDGIGSAATAANQTSVQGPVPGGAATATKFN